MGITYEHPDLDGLQNTKEVQYDKLKEAETPSERVRQAQHEAAKHARRRGVLEQPHNEVERFEVHEIRDEDHDAIDSPELIQEWIDEAYNDCIFTRVEDGGKARTVVITNGSAAYQVEVHTIGGAHLISGERYGEEIEDRCTAGKEELLQTLQQTI